MARATQEQIRANRELIKPEHRRRGVKLNWNDPHETLLEAWLSRGDRRMAEVVHRAWQGGAKFDAWQEHPTYKIWMAAFEVVGLDPAFYTHRERPIDEAFPWDHISTTVRKKFLADDYAWSQRGETRIDCRHQCFACGVLPTFAAIRSEHPGEVWQCPEVKPKADRKRATTIPLSDITIAG